MKINGQEIKGKNIVKVFIPRQDSGYEFSCQPVDMDKFEEIFKVPVPPNITRPGKAPQPDLMDKNYRSQLEDYGKQRINYMIISSILATEGFTWDTINMDDPSTWGNFHKEFKDADLNQAEVNRIINGVLKANSLDEQHIKEAYNHFLAMKRLGEVNSLFHKDEQEIMESGEHVSDLV